MRRSTYEKVQSTRHNDILSVERSTSGFRFNITMLYVNYLIFLSVYIGIACDQGKLSYDSGIMFDQTF